MRLESSELNRENFRSQIVRTVIGERTFTDLAIQTQSNQSLIKRVFDGGLKFTGFLLKTAFSFITWSFSGLWEFLIETAYEISYFDFNQSDIEIQREVEQNNQLIFNQLGQLLGSSVVWLGSIAVAGALTIKFPVVSGRIALALADEANSTLRGQFTSALQVN